MALRITSEDRRLARERNHFVLHLCLVGAERRPPAGDFELVNTLPIECAAELLALLRRWEEEEKI